jgi:hypothetical protein
MSVASVPTVPPRRRRRWPWLLVLGVLLLLLPWTVLVAYWRYQDGIYAERVRQAEARADQLDPDWRLDEIEARRAVIPEDENAVVRVRAARARLPKRWPPNTFGDAWQDHPVPALLDREQISILRAEMGEVVAAVTEARRLKEMRRGRPVAVPDENPLNTHIPDVQPAREIAKLLAADALLRTQDGDLDGACESCRAALIAGCSLGDDPFLISFLVRCACRDMAVRALERMLAQGEPSEGQLLAMTKAVEDELPEPLLLYGLRGERAMIHDLSVKVERRQIALGSLSGGPGNCDTRPPEGWEHVSNLWVIPRVRRGHAELLETLSDAVEAAKLPPEQQGPTMEKIYARQSAMSPFDSPYYFLLYPHLKKSVPANSRGVARLRCTLVAIALERYRRKHGRWPAILADLRPDFLPNVPLDPFDGQALRYRRDDQGVIVYSVGEDGKDNGGDRQTLNTFKDGTDLGFRLWDVDKRRQPPPPKAAENPAALPGAAP